MKIKDLIEKLKTYDPELLIVARGMDEFGFCDLEIIQTINLKNRQSAMADYEETDPESGQLALVIDHH